MARWRYRLDDPYEITSPHLVGVSFHNHWLTIANTHLIVSAGYAWDGCSPSWPLGPLWIGTWDGPRRSDGRPAAFYASLVHDALSQFSSEIPITREATLRLFADMLAARQFPHTLIQLYTWAVRHFGPQDFGGGIGMR